MESKNVLSFRCVNPNKFNKQSEGENLEPNLFYDKNAKKIISINDERIQIFNKTTTNLKQDIDIKLNKNEVKFVVVDKELKYMILIMEKKQDSDLNIGIMVNLKKVSTTQIIEGDYDYLLGIFFIKKNKNFVQNIKKEKKTHFCFVFIDRIAFYTIDTDKDTVKEVESETFNINELIKDYSYNLKYKILCCSKNNNSFEFYNLSKKKFYSKSINKAFSFLPIEKKGSFFQRFSKVNWHELKRIKDRFSSRDKYTESQFFLETLYDSLYFIFLHYGDNKIHICKINSLKDIQEIKIINYKNHNLCSSLQFFDNLLIVHNFLKRFYIIIDIQSKETIINIESQVNFPYEKNIFINGELLEERNNDLKGMIIYNCYFNCKNYEEISFATLGQRNQNNQNKQKKEMKITKYDILVNLLRRKNAKEIILDSLYKIIYEKEKFINVVKILQEIVKQFIQTSPNAILNANSKNEILTDENNPSELPKLIEMFVYHKKVIIKQSDIFYFLFKKFENEQLSQEMIGQIIEYMIIFYQEMCQNKIQVQPSFYIVLCIFLRKCNDSNRIMNWFSFNGIPDHLEIANFLVDLTEKKKNDSNYQFFSQKGLEMLIKLKKHENIIDFLFKTGKISEALYYIKCNKNYFNKQQLRKYFLNNIQFLKKTSISMYLR